MNEYYEENISARNCFGWNESVGLFVEIFGAHKITDKKAFGCYVNAKINNFLEKKINYKAYVVLVKTFYQDLLRIDHFKKIWKLDFVTNYHDQLDNKREIYTEHQNYKLYFGMASIKNKHEFDFYNFLSEYSYMNTIFFSQNEYPLELVESILFADSKKTPEINYQKFCEYFCKNGDTVVRLGVDAIGSEIELMYKKYTYSCIV